MAAKAKNPLPPETLGNNTPTPEEIDRQLMLVRQGLELFDRSLSMQEKNLRQLEDITEHVLSLLSAVKATVKADQRTTAAAQDAMEAVLAAMKKGETVL